MTRLRDILSIVWGVAVVSVAVAQEVPLPEIDLSRLEPQVRRGLEAAQSALLTALDDETIAPAERARLLGETGELFQANGVLDFAAACYRQAADLAPKAFRWRYLLGVLSQDTGRFEEAAGDYRRALELRPDDSQARLRLARAELARGDLATAQAMLRELTHEAGVAAAAHGDLARLAEANGEIEEAIGHYRAALDEQPEATQLYFPLVAALRRAGEEEEAQRLAARADPRARLRFSDPIVEEVLAHTTSSETYARIGLRAARSGDPDAAVAAFRTALELQPENDRARTNLAAAELERGNLDEAERLLRQTLERDPGYAHAHFNLGRVLEQRGDTARAIRHYAAAVDADPTNTEFLFGHGRLLMRSGDFATAVARLASVVDRAPGFLQARYLLALAHEAMGDRAAARRTLVQAHEVAPDRVDIALALVRMTSTSGDATIAERRETLALARTLFRQQRDAERAEALAMALAADGQFDAAIPLQEALIETIQQQAGDAEVLAFLEENLERYRNREPAVNPWPR